MQSPKKFGGSFGVKGNPGYSFDPIFFNFHVMSWLQTSFFEKPGQLFLLFLVHPGIQYSQSSHFTQGGYKFDLLLRKRSGSGGIQSQHSDYLIVNLNGYA